MSAVKSAKEALESLKIKASNTGRSIDETATTGESISVYNRTHVYKLLKRDWLASGELLSNRLRTITREIQQAEEKEINQICWWQSLQTPGGLLGRKSNVD